MKHSGITGLHTYKCRFANHWHIGHMPKFSPQEDKRKRRLMLRLRIHAGLQILSRPRTIPEKTVSSLNRIIARRVGIFHTRNLGLLSSRKQIAQRSGTTTTSISRCKCLSTPQRPPSRFDDNTPMGRHPPLRVPFLTFTFVSGACKFQLLDTTRECGQVIWQRGGELLNHCG